MTRKVRVVEMRGFGRRTRLVDVAGGGVVVGLVVGAGWLAQLPVSESRERSARLRADVASAEGDVERLEGRLSSLEASEADLRDRIERNAVELSPGHTVNAQIARIADLADRAALTLGQIRPGEAEEVGEHTERPITLIGTGTFPSIVAFVESLESSFADLTLRSFDINADVEATENTRFVLELVWFADRAGA